MACGFSASGSRFEPPALIAGFHDVAVMGEAVEERGCHLGVAEHAGPFAERQVRRDDDRGPLVEPADQVEQQLTARLRERQIAQLIKDQEVQPAEKIGHASLAFGARLGVELLTRSTTLKKRPRLPLRRPARAMATARCDFPVPVPPISTMLRC